MQDGATNACRSSGVKFVRVQLALDYADLNRIDPAPNCVLRGEYYIQLPCDVSQYSVRYKYLLWARPAKARR